MKHTLSINLLCGLAMACASAGMAWETKECIYRGGDWTIEVPTSCSDVCKEEVITPENLQWIKEVLVREVEDQNPNGPWVLVDNCWVHQWACQNGFHDNYECMSLSLSHESGAFSLGSGRPYYDEDGTIEPLRPLKESISRSWETGSDEYSEEYIEVAGARGIAEVHITKKFATSSDDCEMESRKAGAFVRFRNVQISLGYSEHYLKSGSCRERMEPDAPGLEPFKSSPGDARAALVSFVEYLAAKTKQAYAYGKSGVLPEDLELSGTEPQTAAAGVAAEASADGYEMLGETLADGEPEPSQIMITGFVRDTEGQPIAGATLRLPQLNASAVSDSFGSFRLSAVGPGEQPLVLEWNPVLERKIGAVKITADWGGKALAVPSSGAQPFTVPLGVALEECPEQSTGPCRLLSAGRVELEILNQDALPFVSLTTPNGIVDKAGSWRTNLELRALDASRHELEKLWRTAQQSEPPAITIELAVRAFLPDGTRPKAEDGLEIPLDLMLIRGTTVDERMRPRTEAEPPRFVISPRAHLSSELAEDDDGVFFVAVEPSKITKDPSLVWKPTCHLPLSLPFSYLEKTRGITPQWTSGELVDIGLVDLLSGEEHERRLKGWVREFLGQLGWDNGEVGRATTQLSALQVAYSVPDISVPRYGMGPGIESIFNMAGVIQVGETEGDYWGSKAFTDQDPPYAIFLHELGHYVHKKIGDRWIEACLWDKRWAGAEHSTWKTPTVHRTFFPEKGKMLTSFFEATGDFFASLVFDLVELQHPEMKDSLYVQRGYLEEFDTPDKAMAAVQLGGCRVEGIQATFLRALYAQQLAATPARAFGDFLRMVDAFKSESWVMRWVPARSITEWLQMKRKHGGLSPSADLESLVRRYAIEACTAGIMIYPADPKAHARIRIDGTGVTLRGDNVAQSVVIGQTVNVEQGVVAVLVQVWGSGGESRVLAASAGSSFAVLAADQVAEELGTVVVDGTIAVKTLGGTVTPTGTSFMVDADAEGDSTIKVLDGSVQIASRKGTERLAAGQAATLGRRGKVKELPRFSPEEVKQSFITPAPAAPPPPVEPQEPAAAASSQPSEPAAGASSAGASFFAVRQKSSGSCVVVVGATGLGPGDVIFGSFASYAEAQSALGAQCGQPRGSSPAAPAPSPAPPTQVADDSKSAFVSPVLAVPKYDNDEATEGIFFVNLDTGNAFFIDRLRSSPLSIRSRSLNQNVFTALGRPLGRSALPGEILVGAIRSSSDVVNSLLLVDSTSGAMSYITDLKNRSYRGNLRPVQGRPASRVAAADGNFCLVMRRSDSGRTEGAYLYHGTTGRCLYVEGLGRLDVTLEAGFTSPLPTLSGHASALAIDAGGGHTHRMLVVDDGTGEIHVVGGLKKKPRQLHWETARKNLFDQLPRSVSVSSPQRFVLVPLYARSGDTEAALVVDVGTGGLAVLENIRDAEKLDIELARHNLYEVLPQNVSGQRVLTAVPKVNSGGATEGAWVFDSITGEAVFIDDPRHPERLEVHAVKQKAK